MLCHLRQRELGLPVRGSVGPRRRKRRVQALGGVQVESERSEVGAERERVEIGLLGTSTKRSQAGAGVWKEGEIATEENGARGEFCGWKRCVWERSL